MVRSRRRAALTAIGLGAGLLTAIGLGARLLINSIRAADAQEPPALMVEAQFPGMPASVVEERVAATLETKINGVENLERLHSRCGRDGSYSLEIAFQRGTDPNLAQMLVQNRVNDAMPLLPEEVRRLGVTVRKAPSVLVMLLTISSPDASLDSSFLNNAAMVLIRPELARLPGVAEVSLHGFDGYAARILLDPQKLATHKLTVPDVKRAIEQQALEATSGPRGGFQFTPAARGGLTKPDQLAPIAIRSDPERPAIRVEDVKSDIRMGGDQVGFASLDGKPAAVLAIYASAWADPREVSAALRGRFPELRGSFPPGVELSADFEFTAPATAGAPDHLLLDVNLPPAGPGESPRELLARTDQSLREIPGVRRVLALSGQPFDRDRDQPCLVVGLGQVDGAPVDRERILREIRTRFNATEKSASIRTRDLPGYARSRRSGYPIEFAIPGFDRQRLRELADKIVARMSREPRLTEPWAGPRQVPTYAVDIDRARMERLSLALPDVSTSLQAVFGSVQAGNLQAPFGREYPILLKIDPAGRGEVERLIRTNLRTARGESISLSEVAAVHLENQPAFLERFNIYPVIVITAGLDGDLSLAEARFLCERLVAESNPDARRPRIACVGSGRCRLQGPRPGPAAPLTGLVARSMFPAASSRSLSLSIGRLPRGSRRTRRLADPWGVILDPHGGEHNRFDRRFDFHERPQIAIRSTSEGHEPSRCRRGDKARYRGPRRQMSHQRLGARWLPFRFGTAAAGDGRWSFPPATAGGSAIRLTATSSHSTVPAGQ
jgi:multidrug efflux pump subunit AcrB